MAILKLRDGAELYYEVQGEGPPLLLVPGLGGVGTFFAEHVPELAKRFRVVVHDHRGTGRSTPSRIDYSVEQMTGDLLQLMDALDLRKAHLCGHSTGGVIGQTLALDRPERLDRLVLSATWTKADAYFHRLLEVRAETLRKAGPALYVRSNALWMRPPALTRDRLEHETKLEEAAIAAFPPVEVMLSRIAAIRRFDRSSELGNIRHKTLVFVARDDMVTPRYYSEELARLIPDARLVMLPDGGHFYPNVHGETFRRTVSDFLAAAL